MRHPTGANPDIDWKAVRLLVFGLDDQFRFLVRQTFRKLNVRDVMSCGDPADAAGLVARGVDLLLVDLGAGHESGLTVIGALRRAEPDPQSGLPILVVAHPPQKEIVARAQALGIEGIIPKPVSGHELSHRVADTLATPRRLPRPAPAPEKPRVSYVKDPDEPSEPPPAPAAAPIPEVAALAARLAARDGAAQASSCSERPDRGGPWSALADVRDARPLPVRSVPPASPPVPPPPAPPVAAVPVPPAPAPAPVPSSSRPDGNSGGGGECFRGGDLAPAGKSGGGFPSGGGLGLDDLAPARRPSGGKLDLDDLAPVKRPSGGRLDAADLAPLRPDPDAEAARRRAEKRKQQWQEALAKSGHKTRKGHDVAALDVSVVVAEHAAWLQSNGAEGKRATFQGMDLTGIDLSGALLANATFREVDLSDACLAEARLDGSDFRYATLSAADLAGANLGVAALRHAKLDLSNLEGAVLRGSDLSGARLSGARLAGADLKGTVLIGADLRAADLSRVEGLTQAQVEKSLCDTTTRLPPGVLRPERAG